MVTLINDFLRRRWYDFRQGYSIYLSFPLIMLSFITVIYGLLIVQVPALTAIFPTWWHFSILVIVVLPVIGSIIGYWHRRLQLPTEAVVATFANPFTFKVIPESKEAVFMMPFYLLFFRMQRELILRYMPERTDLLLETDRLERIAEALVSGLSSDKLEKSA